MNKEERQEKNKLIHIHLDPTKAYTDVPKSRLLDACGYIPAWATEPRYLHLPLKEALDTQYCCGLFEMSGTVNKDGIFQYPDDPDIPPFIKINRGEETLYMYRNAIVAIIDEQGETFITRMD